MKEEGNILKMQAELDKVVRYTLPVGDSLIPLNAHIGEKMRITFKNRINCIRCGKVSSKSFNQGFCYSCFISAPENDPGVFHPELDQAHLGISRDMEYAKHYSLVEHSVYLAITSGLKVGVTRSANVLTRWMDQGAVMAMRIAETLYRNLAGQIEVALKAYYDDKTNWQTMLTKAADTHFDLVAVKSGIINLLPDDLKPYVLEENEIVNITYPITEYPLKVKSHDLDKMPVLEGVLTGIKGQYLLFGSTVINIRKYQGYLILLEI